MAQVAVIGLGRFGYHVARALHEAGHEVLAVDVNPDLVQRIRDCSAQAVVLDARLTERLRHLGLADFDVAVVSLGERIDTSSLVTLHLRELGVGRIIVKAASEDHGRLLEMIGADEIVFPERQSAERLAQRLSNANVLDLVPLGEHHSIHELAAPEEFVGRTLADLRLRNRFGVQVLALRWGRAGELTVNPTPDQRIDVQHVLYLLGSNRDLDKLRKLHPLAREHKAPVAGGLA